MAFEWLIIGVGLAGLAMLILGRVPVHIFKNQGEIEGIWVRVSGLCFFVGFLFKYILNLQNSLLWFIITFGLGILTFFIAAFSSASGRIR